ncbi:MAG: hypothetical protein GY847_27545 [Proteobacteria bacterium]|nr:hypothetical protein [Pseudomonadota bacterium]
MKKNIKERLGFGLCVLITVLVLGLALSCSTDDATHYNDRESIDTNSDQVANSDAGKDAGDDEGLICSEVDWGYGISEGMAPSNWAFSGYVDSDGDGYVELEEVDFDLEDIHCTGKQSLLIALGDTSCPSCPFRFQKLGEIEQYIVENNGLILGIYMQDLGSTAPIEKAFSNLKKYFKGSYFSGDPPQAAYKGLPYEVLIDLEDMHILAHDWNGRLPIETIMELVKEADED